MVISQIKMPIFKKVGKSKYEWQFDTHRGFIQKMPNSSIWAVWQPSVQDRMLGKFRTLTTAKEHVCMLTVEEYCNLNAIVLLDNAKPL